MRRVLAGACALGVVTALGCGDGSEPAGVVTPGVSDPATGTATSDLSPRRRPAGPCDVLGAAGNTCAAAHSTVRALYSSYSGNLYQLKRADGITKNIGVLASGFADAASQDGFCSGSSCTISTIYDQSSNGNHLTPAPAGGAKSIPDNAANATDLKTTIAGHTVYGILVKPGIGYRKLVGARTATGDQPETEYMVSSQLNLVNGCCFDYGNAETDAHDDGNGAAEAVSFGDGVVWGTGSPGGHNNGPWVMADLENGLYAGWENNQDQNISTNTPLRLNFVTAVVVGDTAAQNAGKGRFALYGGDATSGTVKTMYDGIRPAKPGYVPMKKQGSIVLGIAGDNSDSDGGEWYEGVMASGAATLATVNSLQANIVAAGYGR
jgi:non-reducing end alpha-L-arabinofuranosidase